MTATTSPMCNGVDVPTLFATIDAVRQQPAAAQFRFRVRNRWVSGTNSMSTVGGFYGVGREQDRDKTFVLEADHPKVLVGQDRGPTPAEHLLAALAACLTAGIGNIAAARGIELTEVESTVEGDVDLQGILGLSDEVRNGYEQIRVSFQLRGNGSPEQLRKIVEQARARSAVFDVLTNGVPVMVDVDASTTTS
jgi:uncharacterized OsmC-like protein